MDEKKMLKAAMHNVLTAWEKEFYENVRSRIERGEILSKKQNLIVKKIARKVTSDVNLASRSFDDFRDEDVIFVFGKKPRWE